MDPAFSLADELAAYTSPGDHLADEIDGMYGGAKGGTAMDDLASELQDVLLVGDHDTHYTHMGGGSLADELFDQHLDLHRASSPSSPSMSSIAPHASTATTTPAATDSTSPIASSLRRSSSASVDEIARLTQAFLHRLASLSEPAIDAEGNSCSDTARLELLAAKVVQLLYQCTVEREAQIRELRDLERQASRLPHHRTFSLTSSQSHSSDLGPGSTARLGFGHGEVQNERSSDDEDDGFYTGETSTDTLPSVSPSRARRISRRSNASLASDTTVVSATSLIDPSLFTELHTTTRLLLTSLTELHELAQVEKTNVTDAARKLKSARNILTQYRADDESVEQSLLFIAAQQSPITNANVSAITTISKTAPAPTPTPTPVSAKQWTEEQLDFCRRTLQEADTRARTLLTPIFCLVK